MTRLNKAAGKLLYEDVNIFFEESLEKPDRNTFASTPRPIEYSFKVIGSVMSVFLYKPKLSDEEAFESHSSTLYMFFILVGFKIYEKEREIRTRGAQIKYILEKSELNKITRNLIYNLSEPEKFVLSQPAGYAVDLSFDRAQERVDVEKRVPPIEGKEFLQEKFWQYLPSAIVIGYNFAHEVIFPQIPIDPTWPKRVMKRT